jgi:ectoine hydroxylase-related dioxygenase (phytanoyl-CoA dioxygenase family)
VEHPSVVEAARWALRTRDIVVHFMNVTAKAPYIGSGVGWHRDADNRYMRSRDGHFVRIMICLDAMGPANGGTRFQIGSHRLARPKDGLATVAPACPAGTILVVHPKVRHGGPPNHSPYPRRLAVIQYGRRDDPIIAEERESLTGMSPDAIRGRSRRIG